jgi:hypothetical protein
MHNAKKFFITIQEISQIFTQSMPKVWDPYLNKLCKQSCILGLPKQTVFQLSLRHSD